MTLTRMKNNINMSFKFTVSHEYITNNLNLFGTSFVYIFDVAIFFELWQALKSKSSYHFLSSVSLHSILEDKSSFGASSVCVAIKIK